VVLPAGQMRAQASSHCYYDALILRTLERSTRGMPLLH